MNPTHLTIIYPRYTAPPAILFAGGAADSMDQMCTHPPAAAGLKFLLDFFTKKSRVQGSALSLPAQGRVQGSALPLPA